MKTQHVQRIFLLGPTGSGKSRCMLEVHVAKPDSFIVCPSLPILGGMLNKLHQNKNPVPEYRRHAYHVEGSLFDSSGKIAGSKSMDCSFALCVKSVDSDTGGALLRASQRHNSRQQKRKYQRFAHRYQNRSAERRRRESVKDSAGESLSTQSTEAVDQEWRRQVEARPQTSSRDEV